MVGLGETYLPAFVLAVGLGDVASALVATLPMLLGAGFQLATPMAVRRLGSYRRWVVFCARVQALSFAPLIAGAWLGHIKIGWVLAAAAVYWGFGMATGPAWNAWVTSLVRREARADFFARRTQLAQAALLAALAGAGLALEIGQRDGRTLGVFGVLFGLAALSRLVSSAFLARQSEPPGLAMAHVALPAREVLAKLRAAGSLRVLAYLLAMQVAANIASPYFTAYMLGPLDLRYWQFVSLTAISFVARVAVMPALGRFARTEGTRVLLWLGAVSIVPLPSLWLLSDELWYLLLVQALAGVAWGALELATMLSFFDGIDDSDRASVLSAFNLFNAAAVATGAFCGARVLELLGTTPLAYASLFVISSVARAFILPLLVGSRAARRVPAGLQLRTLAVRPAAGAVQRPILPSLDDDAPETDAPRTRRRRRLRNGRRRQARLRGAPP